MSNEDDTLALANFREYLQIPSVHPNIDYGPCVAFLRKMATSIDLPITVHEYVPEHPIVIISWTGSDPSLSTVLLQSHMDVVPAFAESWTHPPFSAHVDEDGKIFGRGSQDMKSVGIQFLEAVRRFKKDGVVLKRTVHILFVSAEEIGGRDGMGKFVQSDDFKNLNVGVCMGEGIATTGEPYTLFYGERILCHTRVHCHGTAGHGSLFLQNTAGEKLRYIIDKFMDLRKEQEELLRQNPNFQDGDVTSVNLTMLRGGTQSNVVPEVLTAVFDIRVSPRADFTELEEKMRRWCLEAGSDVELEFVEKDKLRPNTVLDDTNKFWVAFKSATDELGLIIEPKILPAVSDHRFIRELGIPAFAFSPMNHTPVLMHAQDEYLGTDTFLKGIPIYQKIIQNLANVD